jgi:hypothetical protein
MGTGPNWEKKMRASKLWGKHTAARIATTTTTQNAAMWKSWRIRSYETGALSAGLRITGWNDRGCLNHKDYCAFRGTRAMNDALWHNKALLLSELDTSILEINDETTVKDKEELVVIVVFVPVVFALHDAEANDRIVHLTQRLVVPGVGTGRHQ